MLKKNIQIFKKIFFFYDSNDDCAFMESDNNFWVLFRRFKTTLRTSWSKSEVLMLLWERGLSYKFSSFLVASSICFTKSNTCWEESSTEELSSSRTKPSQPGSERRRLSKSEKQELSFSNKLVDCSTTCCSSFLSSMEFFNMSRVDLQRLLRNKVCISFFVLVFSRFLMESYNVKKFSSMFLRFSANSLRTIDLTFDSFLERGEQDFEWRENICAFACFVGVFVCEGADFLYFFDSLFYFLLLQHLFFVRCQNLCDFLWNFVPCSVFGDFLHQGLVRVEYEDAVLATVQFACKSQTYISSLRKVFDETSFISGLVLWKLGNFL